MCVHACVCWEWPCLNNNFLVSHTCLLAQSLGLCVKVPVQLSTDRYRSWSQLRTNIYKSCGQVPSNPFYSVLSAEYFTQPTSCSWEQTLSPDTRQPSIPPHPTSCFYQYITCVGKIKICQLDQTSWLAVRSLSFLSPILSAGDLQTLFDCPMGRGSPWPYWENVATAGYLGMDAFGTFPLQSFEPFLWFSVKINLKGVHGST